jgi:L,D-peptidoglycan transpeptidase YkuD (ErfK/YbiS/YcfS/YnhG family)
MHKSEIVRALAAVATLTVLAAAVAARPAHAAPITRASTVSGASTATTTPVRQLITVTAASHGTTYATFRAYQITGTKKVLVFGPWVARVGYNGIALPGRKREGDGKTPSGTYGFSFFFGVDPNPGVAFPYRRAYRYDYWDDDSRSPRYNEWVDARRFSPGANPEPMRNVPAYDFAAVIAYNTARVPHRGSAIFLHVGTGGATAGCVSLPVKQLLRVLRWLRPARHPVITIAAR